jgi:hypothetical protein
MRSKEEDRILNAAHINVIVPATDEKQVARLQQSLDKLEDDNHTFKMIPIYGAVSFFDAWREGLKETYGSWIVLTHQDTEFHYFPTMTTNPQQNMPDRDFDLGGVAGCIDYDINEPWWFTRDRYMDGKLSGQIYHDTGHKSTGESKGLSFFGEYGEVDILDGVCLVTTKQLLEDVLRDIKCNVTWDWYDHVLSTAYKRRGLVVKTIPILMTHGSAGGDRRNTFEKERKNYVKWYQDKSNN